MSEILSIINIVATIHPALTEIIIKQPLAKNPFFQFRLPIHFDGTCTTNDFEKIYASVWMLIKKTIL